MAGDVEIEWRDFTRDIAFHPAVVGAVRNATARGEQAAKDSAPVKTGAYRDSIRSEVDMSGHAPVGRVVATDSAAMAIEAYTGNMARASRRARPRG